MDKATLVKSDLEIEGRILEALSRANIPVTVCDWNYVSETDEWQLTIATPLFDNKGPLEANSRVIAALQSAGIYNDVPIRRVTVMSPNDELVKSMERDIKVRTEGAIHLIDHNHGKANNDKVYAVIFAPFTGPGGTVPSRRIKGLGELRKFLEDRLHIRKTTVEEALTELSREGSASIFNVQLTNREAKKVGLA